MSLDLSGPLADKVADKSKELSNIIFAHGFAGITDLKIGPDGYLYILVYESKTEEFIKFIRLEISKKDNK